jgi:hypothetical protein
MGRCHVEGLPSVAHKKKKKTSQVYEASIVHFSQPHDPNDSLSIFSPNSVLKPRSQTPLIYARLLIRDQVLYPFEPGNIIILYILIFTVSDRK